MYSELIYTRCGEGIDILRGRHPINNSGFKVFSCSDKVTEEGIADLPLLYATAQSKETYADPSFMDDAYLYVVPDSGEKFLLNFHPIPFDKNATGDYSHRPGNFINQIFIGRFEDVYPYETFGNETVWDAQKRGEAFYYENSPTSLALRDNLTDSVGKINLDDIASFVADGRRETLMSAIAFVISQYSLPPEERKFLVIRDENSRQIELWVAAIESAFSPRMASGLSFATRLDKFVNANRYTVNLSGQYQTQINLQSPNQKLRYKAMIVGVDERDRTNTAAARALANSPFVVLDGKTKTLSTSVDASPPYYRYVTAYDQGHSCLCREFMQMVDISCPGSDVLKLYTAYMELLKHGPGSSLKHLLSALGILGEYRLIKTPYLEKLYCSIKQSLPQYLKEDAVSAFYILNWLEEASVVVGDNNASDSFEYIVCGSYADNVFMYPRSNATAEIQRVVGTSSFAKSAAMFLVKETTVASYNSTMQGYRPSDWIAFSELFTDCLRLKKGAFPDTVNAILPQSINALYQARYSQGAEQVAALYAALNSDQSIEILLTEAGYSTDQRYIGFLIKLITRISTEVVSSESGLMRFYRQLRNYKLESYFADVLADKARTITYTQEMENFLDWMLASKDIMALDLSAVFEAIDKNLPVTDKTAAKVAFMIQRYKPHDVVCVNSAHVYALEILDDKKIKDNLVPLLDDLLAQGFPTLEDEAYAKKVVSKIFSNRLFGDAFATIVAAASGSSFYADMIVEVALSYLGSRHDGAVGALLEVAAKINSETLFDSFVDACVNLRQFEKGTAAIRATIRSKGAQQYFALIEREARVQYNQKKEPSLFGRLFSRGSSNDSSSGKSGKK